MLKAMLDLFKESSDNDQETHTVELATATLFSEIIRADRDIQQAELDTYREKLAAQFGLSDHELDTLMQEGQEMAEDAVDFVQFTQVINEKCSNEQKITILKGLWQVAYADNEIAPIEEHTVRRIADLLYIPHSQFIKTKLDVTGE
ncbi:tellurite resistance TerB family protein [Alteromonas halophila]|uniref:Co-chaperone DjlA N-terminal domain-containing protein n=1 Tax=Alteromonas halophila TaxID=516698 RepID=A0A918MUW0_9ALTE|nr:TerB family tellurite resistance protein [Alteromonas halophila]GGW74797.1 hypothetical protein GCM10007391_03600 [Alteromonas halophila]